MIILLYHYLFSIVFIILYFHFRSRISFTFTFRILSVLVSHLLFYLVFALFHLLSFLLSIIPRDILTQKCRAKTKSFILFSSRHINIRFIFFFTIIILYGAMFYVLLNSCFDLLSVSLKIADSSVFGTLRRVSFPAKLVAGGLKLGKKWGLGCSKNIMPSASVLRCFQLSWSILLLPSFVLIYLWILWIFYFTNYYFITCTGNPGRLMRWSFLKK